jgi:hypothetical protein
MQNLLFKSSATTAAPTESLRRLRSSRNNSEFTVEAALDQVNKAKQ